MLSCEEVAFPEYLRTIAVAFNGVRSMFILPDDIFLSCDHALDFDISLCENSVIQSIKNQSSVHCKSYECSQKHRRDLRDVLDNGRYGENQAKHLLKHSYLW